MANLYKLDNRATDDVRKFVNLVRTLFVRRTAATTKEYPNVLSAFRPLNIYFGILLVIAAQSRSTQLSCLTAGVLQYSTQLLTLGTTHNWPAVLAFHQAYYKRRQTEMLWGDYSGWMLQDLEAVAEHLFEQKCPGITTVSSSSP